MPVQGEHFSENFFEDIIKTKFKHDVNVLSVEKSNVVPPGENYICELFRVLIRFCEKNSNDVQSVHWIMKSLLDVDVVLEFDKETDVFNRELTVYRDILPILEKKGQQMKVSPQVCYLSEESKKVIILEDLSALNYKMVNRQEGLDLDHCLLTIEKLAYYHAASLAIYEQNPELIRRYDKGLFYKTNTLIGFLSVALKETAKIWQREPGLQKYALKINQDLVELSYTITKPDPKFNVLNHGDFWCNNLMFKYSESDHLVDVLFVDFQMTVFTSPFFDLHSFFATSTNIEVKEKHMETILSCYYDNFCKHAKILKLTTQIPNRQEFNKEFVDKAYIGFIMMATFLPFFKADKRKDASFINFMQNDGEGSFRYHCYNNDNILTNFKCLLAIYDRMGLFDN